LVKTYGELDGFYRELGNGEFEMDFEVMDLETREDVLIYIENEERKSKKKKARRR
jgi:hypothetical protein